MTNLPPGYVEEDTSLTIEQEDMIADMDIAIKNLQSSIKVMLETFDRVVDQEITINEEVGKISSSLNGLFTRCAKYCEKYNEPKGAKEFKEMIL